jgi:hypothetical protein
MKQPRSLRDRRRWLTARHARTLICAGTTCAQLSRSSRRSARRSVRRCLRLRARRALRRPARAEGAAAMGATRGSLTLALLCAAALSGARGETRDDACTRCGCRAGPYTPPCAGVGLRFPRLCGRADCRACAAQGLRCRRHLRRRRLGVHAHGAWRSAHAARHPLAAARAAPEPCGLCFPRAGLAAARRRRAARRARDAHRPGRRLHRLPARFRRAGNRVQRRCVCQRGACPPPHRSRHAPRRHSDAAPPLRWTWRACWRAKLRGSRRGCPGFWTAFAPRERVWGRCGALC